MDYHVHAVAHGEFEYTYEWISKFLKKACLLGLQEIGFAEHDEYRDQVDYELIDKLQNEFPDLQIRCGLEVDYIPGREREIQGFLAEKDYDFVIGSVHFIDGWGFDHPDFRQGFYNKDIDEIYASYFSLVRSAVESGLFDIVGHLDLIKIWGHRPRQQDISFYSEPLLNCVKEHGTVIEINSSGMRKPVGEIYPAPEILEMMLARDIPITLGSDAHHPDQLGEGILQAVALVRKIGYRNVVKFEQRRKILTSIE